MGKFSVNTSAFVRLHPVAMPVNSGYHTIKERQVKEENSRTLEYKYTIMVPCSS
jgi:hypothetical protein